MSYHSWIDRFRRRGIPKGMPVGLRFLFVFGVLLSTTAMAQSSIGLSPEDATQGGQSTISVALGGIDPSWAGMSASITLPAEVEFVSITPSASISGFDFDAAYDPASRKLGVIAYSSTGNFGATDLDALDILVSVPFSTPPGDYPVTFTMDKTGISNADGSVSEPHVAIDGVLTVLESTAMPTYPLPLIACLGVIATLFLVVRFRPQLRS